MLKASTGDEITVNHKGKAMFGAKVREVVIATNNEPMKITERNGGISRAGSSSPSATLLPIRIKNR